MSQEDTEYPQYGQPKRGENGRFIRGRVGPRDPAIGDKQSKTKTGETKGKRPRKWGQRISEGMKKAAKIRRENPS